MARLLIPICVALLAILTTAHADMYLYSCKMGKNNFPLVVDDEEMTLGWQGTKHVGIGNAMEDSQTRCGKAGWHVEDGEASFDFCVGTKGYGAIQKQDRVVTACDLQATFTNPYPQERSKAANSPIADAANKPRTSTETAVGNLLSRMAGSDGKPARMIGPDEWHPTHDPDPVPTQNNPGLSCSSDDVKKILYDGTLGKTLGYVEVYRKRTGNNGSPAAIALEEVSHWRGKVVNIRETSREPGSVSCAAEFEWQNLPSKQSLGMVGMILLTEGIRDESCIKVNYKVQPLLDKPGQIYVSWRCNDG
jgi:hypothetical protein